MGWRGLIASVPGPPSAVPRELYPRRMGLKYGAEGIFTTPAIAVLGAHRAQGKRTGRFGFLSLTPQPTEGIPGCPVWGTGS